MASLPTNGHPPRENLYRANYQPGALRLRDFDNGGKPLLELHFAPFGEWVEIDSTFEGHFMERFLPGSLKKTLAERAAKMKCLFNHGRDVLGKQTLGRFVALQESEEDGFGQVELFDGIPPLVLSGLRAGEYGASHQFEIVREDFVPRPRSSDYNPDGIPERSIIEAKIFEIGPCTFPAYSAATAGVRSITDEFHPAVARLSEDPERLERLLHKTGISLGKWNTEVPSFEETRERSRQETRRYERCVDYVATTAWAIHPAALATVLQIIGERKAGYKPTPEEIRERLGVRAEDDVDVEVDVEAPEEEQPQASPVRVIPVAGVIIPKANMFSEISGAASVESLQRDFRAALADDTVKAVLFDIDSPGGSADLIPEFADEIRAARGRKPIVAVANTWAASAAYWIAAAADELVVTPSGQVGSIGVWTAHEDVSAQQEMEGLKTTLVSAGKYKVEGNQFEPLDDEARAEMQRITDAYYGMFVNAVSKGRGVSVEKVEADFGQGRMVMAPEAVEKGMADRVASFDETLARLEAEAADKQTEDEPERPVATTREEPEPPEATTRKEERRFQSREEWLGWIDRI